MRNTQREKNKISVLFIIPSLRRAGAETQVIDLLNSMDSNKFHLHLFTFHRNIDQYDKIYHEKIKFYNKPRKHKFDFSIAKMAADIIDKNTIDIVHCTLLFSLLVGWMSVKLSKGRPRILAAVHTTKNRSLKDAIFEKCIFQWLLMGCDHVIFVCKKQAEFWKAKYPFLSSNSSFIYNGIDAAYFNPIKFHSKGIELRKALHIQNDSFVICCIAGFRKEKGHDVLIEAFSQLKSQSFLVLAGEGEKKNHIQRLVKKKGLEEKVKFLGNVADVRPILAASNICVLPSTAVETFSIAMLESMSMGVPVIASDIGGLSEAIIPGETGDVVTPGKPDNLSRTLQKIVENPSQCKIMGDNSRELVKKDFSIGKMTKNIETLFLSLIP